MIHLDKETTMFCVGGGPSLKGFDWDKLKGKKVIAINRAFQVLPEAQYIYFSDLKFWNGYREELLKHSAIKVTGDKRIKHDKVVSYRFTGLKGIDIKPGCLRTGNNSGYAAINLAIHLGAKFIMLLGYDMDYTDGTHWHEGYPTRSGKIKKMLPWFDSMKHDLEYLGVQVFNCNKESKIETFSKVNIDYALCSL